MSGDRAERIQHGRHFILSKKDTSLANDGLTLLQQAGVGTPKFSDSDSEISGLLSGPRSTQATHPPDQTLYSSIKSQDP